MIEQAFVECGRGAMCVVWRSHPVAVPSVVICPGLGNSMSEPRYLLTSLARACYEAGFNAVQFDYCGDGDSTGDCGDMTLETLVECARTAIRFAAGLGSSGIILVGYGLGNVIVPRLGSDAGVRACALLDPAVWSSASSAASSTPPLPTAGDDAEPAWPPVCSCGPCEAILWRAIVGEDVLPTQAPAPLTARVLREAEKACGGSPPALTVPTFLATADTPWMPRARSADLTCHHIVHSATEYQPGWQWCFECRSALLTAFVRWLVTNTDALGGDVGETQSGPPRRLPAVRGAFPRESVSLSCFGRTLLGVLHAPPRESGCDVCVIYEPGVPGQRVDVHRCGPRLGDALAKDGLFVFRYDSRGAGVSEGEFHEMTWTTRLDDLCHVIDYLEARGIRRVVVLGNSAGARLAYLAANRDSRVAACVAWGPVLLERQERIGGGVVRKHASGQRVTEYCGLPLGIAYNVDERRYDFVDEYRRCAAPSLIALSAGDIAYNPDNAGAVLQVAQLRQHTVVEFAGAHGFAPAEIGPLIHATRDWLTAWASRYEGAACRC